MTLGLLPLPCLTITMSLQRSRQGACTDAADESARFDVDLDSQGFASHWDRGWPQGKTGKGARLPLDSNE